MHEAFYIFVTIYVSNWSIRCKHVLGNAWSEQFIIIIIIIIIQRHVSSTDNHLPDHRIRLYAVLGSTSDYDVYSERR